MNKELIVQKCVPSLLLFIAGFIVAFIFLGEGVLSSRIGTSFLIGWLAGGTIWGWSLTKSWFPNFKWFYNPRNSNQDWSIEAFKSAIHAFGVIIRIMTAFIVGSIAMPISIIILIATTAKIGSDAYKETAAKAESEGNPEENTNTQ